MLAVIVICGGGLLYGKYGNDKQKSNSVEALVESAYRPRRLSGIKIQPAPGDQKTLP